MAFVPLQPTPLQFQDGNGDPFTGAVLAFFLSGTTTPTNLFSDNTGTSVGNNITLNSSGYPESGNNVITLFSDSSIPIKLILFPNAAAHASLTGAIWTSDTLEDALVLLASTSNAKGASLIGIEDSGALLVATQAEAAFAELAADWAKLARANTFSAIQTFSAALAMADEEVRRPLLVDYAIKHNAVSSVSTTLTLDLSTGGSFVTTLTENTTVVVTNPPASGRYGEFVLKVIQDASGGAFTLTFPASFKWPAGAAPVITTSNGAIDEITARTIDAGTEYRGGFSQAIS